MHRFTRVSAGVVGHHQAQLVDGDVLERRVGVGVDFVRTVAMRNDIAQQDIAHFADRRLLGFVDVSVNLAAADQVEVDGIAIAPPIPVEAHAVDGQVGEHHVLHQPAVENHEGDAAVGAGDDAVVDGNVANGDQVAIAELDGTGSGGQAAVGDGDVLTGARIAVDAGRVKHQGVVAGFDGAVGDMHILTAVRVDTVGPHPVLQAGAYIDVVDIQSLAAPGVHGPGGRIEEGQAGDMDILAADQDHQVPDRIDGGEGAHQRHSGGTGGHFVGINVPVAHIGLAPLILGLAVHHAVAFQGNLLEILAMEQGTPVEVRRIFTGIERGAGFQVNPHMAAQVDGTGGVSAGREVDHPAAGRRAGVDGGLDSRLGQVGFLAGGAVIAHVEDRGWKHR